VDLGIRRKMIIQKLKELGYSYEPAPLEVLTFHCATKIGNLIFTSGQIPVLDDIDIRGKVGKDIDLKTAQKAAEICSYNCLRAAGALVDINTVRRVVKVFGMVNVADGFNQTSEVINGASDFINKVFGKNGYHARSSVGVVLPNGWAVEVEMVFEVL
jgi:enamine deaminase RidA (YjgF/YER057c/UK114 family)